MNKAGILESRSGCVCSLIAGPHKLMVCAKKYLHDVHVGLARQNPSFCLLSWALHALACVSGVTHAERTRSVPTDHSACKARNGILGCCLLIIPQHVHHASMSDDFARFVGSGIPLRDRRLFGEAWPEIHR